MEDREPSVLRGEVVGPAANPTGEASSALRSGPSAIPEAAPQSEATEPTVLPVEPPRPARPMRGIAAPAGQIVVVAGLWRRFAAALVDLVLVVPLAVVLSLLTGKLAGLSLPPTRNAGLDYWLDLGLAGDPALWGGLGLACAIGVLYLYLFQAVLARTPGMRLLSLQVIDVFGDAPSFWRAGLRTLAFLLSICTLGLGFIWIGFDREKRGLHDWLAGTYVIRTGPHSARHTLAVEEGPR